MRTPARCCIARAPRAPIILRGRSPLYDRGFTLARRLARLRRDIAEGRIVRREVHGQPYWVQVA